MLQDETGQKRCRQLLNQGNNQSSYIEQTAHFVSQLYCGKLHRERKTEPAADRSDKWHPNKEPLVTHLQAWLGPVNEADPLGSSSTQAHSGPSSATGPSGLATSSIGNGGRPASASQPSLKERHNPPAAMPGQELGRSFIEEEWRVGTPTKNRSKKRYCGDCDVGYSEGGGFSEVEEYVLLYLSWLSDLCRRVSPFSSLTFSHFVRPDALGPVCGRVVWEEGVSDEYPTNNPRLGHTSMLGRGGWVVRRSSSFLRYTLLIPS
ncbi:hypothetical protein C8J56DRAFT_900124 [Mycena floridula]|nr:hypothetical protein C8J56DRAFT_900124 [Mycena floridula]